MPVALRVARERRYGETCIELRERLNGLDLAAAQGTPVVAAQSGRVTFASYDSGYGNSVRLAGPDGISTLYGHLSGFAVHEGSDVRAGQTIGFVGSTGSSTGPHLHFEIRSGGRLVDPAR